MSRNYRWGKGEAAGGLRVFLFVSRNKDNAGVEGFRERRRSFACYDMDESASYDLSGAHRVLDAFAAFVGRGRPGETCRLYMSVNRRDPDKVRDELLIDLIRNKPDPGFLEGRVAAIAASKECRAESRWLLDVDTTDEGLVDGVLMPRLERVLGDDFAGVVCERTPHGFAVITPHGFDVRGVTDDLGWVSVKKDDLLCRRWEQTPSA